MRPLQLSVTLISSPPPSRGHHLSHCLHSLTPSVSLTPPLLLTSSSPQFRLRSHHSIITPSLQQSVSWWSVQSWSSSFGSSSSPLLRAEGGGIHGNFTNSSFVLSFVRSFVRSFVVVGATRCRHARPRQQTKSNHNQNQRTHSLTHSPSILNLCCDITFYVFGLLLWRDLKTYFCTVP